MEQGDRYINLDMLDVEVDISIDNIYVGNSYFLNLKILLWEAGLSRRETPTLIFNFHSC